MIFDHRTYECRPGTIKAQLALYEEFGYGPQTKHLGMPVLHCITETGNVNEYVHVWVYPGGAGERATKRAAMLADPDWQDYMRRSGEAGYLVRQTNKILKPNDFFDHKT